MSDDARCEICGMGGYWVGWVPAAGGNRCINHRETEKATSDTTRAELVAVRDAAWAKVTGPRIDRTSAAFKAWEAAAGAVIDHDQAERGIKREAIE